MAELCCSGGLAIFGWGVDRLMVPPPPVMAWVFLAGFTVTMVTMVKTKLFTFECYETVQTGST